MDRGEELVLPALRVSGRAARPLRRTARFRPACVPLQRGAELHRARAAGLLDLARRTAVGGADPVGSGSGRLRLGRRARQLPERADVRAARRGSARALLAGRETPARKDILRFHCVYWPAMLLAAGYSVPHGGGSTSARQQVQQSFQQPPYSSRPSLAGAAQSWTSSATRTRTQTRAREASPQTAAFHNPYSDSAAALV